MTEIEQDLWGMTAEGEAIVRYRMRNAQGAEVELTNLGAAVTAVRVPDRNGRIADVALGYGDATDYLRDPANAGKSIGRFANRIGEGRLTIDGEEYRLELNCGRSHLHGGSDGFARRIWESRVEVNRVVMSLLSPDGDQGYPGELEVEAVFDFDDDNALEITYRAATDRTTAVNLTNHLYVNLDGEDAGCVLDHELRLNASQAPETDTRQLPTGRMLDVTDTAMDFRDFRPLREESTTRSTTSATAAATTTLSRWTAGGPASCSLPASCGSARSGRRMEIPTSQPCVVLYTANGLAGGCPLSKSGRRYADYDGVAIECQNFPDAVNRPEFPSALLRPDEIYCQKIVYRFSTFES